MSDRCFNSPTMYHKPGAIHFTLKDRTEFIRACRYCSKVFPYSVIRNSVGTPKIKRRALNRMKVDLNLNEANGDW